MNSLREVAVVIPCYNAAAFLARAIDSVLAQTHPDYLVYAIDDGSTDETGAILRSYGSRVCSVSQPHAGQASARNRGIRLSNSPYVAFLDADDEWLCEKLERQVDLLRRNSQVGMVYSDCSTGGTGPFAGSHFARVGTPAGGRVFAQFLNNCHVFTPTVVVRRECLHEVGLFNESLPVCEDLNLWLRIAARWETAVIPEVLAIRHTQRGGLSETTSVDQAVSSGIASFEHVMRSCPYLTALECDLLRKTIANRYYDYGSYLLQTGNHASSRHQMFQSMRYGRIDWRVLAKTGLSFLPPSAYESLRKIQKIGGFGSRPPAPAGKSV